MRSVLFSPSRDRRKRFGVSREKRGGNLNRPRGKIYSGLCKASSKREACIDSRRRVLFATAICPLEFYGGINRDIIIAYFFPPLFSLLTRGQAPLKARVSFRLIRLNLSNDHGRINIRSSGHDRVATFELDRVRYRESVGKLFLFLPCTVASLQAACGTELQK